jgi:myosin heavy subunit
MENKNQNTVTYVLGAVIALLLIGLFVTVGSNSKNKKGLNAGKIANEKLLTEKLSVDNQLAKLLADFNTLQEKSNGNEKLLSDTRAKLTENEKRISALNGENRSLRSTREELSELKKSKELLESEYAQLKSDNDRLSAKGSELQNSINALEAEKKDLVTKLEKGQLYSTDNFLVTATRGKKTEKVVICASRTKKINMTFEVPQGLTETISFKIVTPTGTTIDSGDNAMSWYVPLDSRNFTASLSSVSGEFEPSRQVILSYSPKTKLAKGEYKIGILSNGINIGNCRIMLK